MRSLAVTKCFLINEVIGKAFVFSFWLLERTKSRSIFVCSCSDQVLSDDMTRTYVLLANLTRNFSVAFFRRVSWDFLTSCLFQLKIPKIWRKALIVAIPKLEKPLGDPKGYHPVSLLCVLFKIVERLICACIEPIVDPLLLQEQVGFRHTRSTVD